MIVEKFGAATLQQDSVSPSPSSGAPNQLPPESWVTVFPKKRSRLPNSLRKRGIASAPSRFTAPKVNVIPSPPLPHPVTTSEAFNAGEEGGVLLESSFDPKPLPPSANLAKFGASSPETDLPENDEDDMDIYLNLEDTEDPQHSSDSSKKRRFEEGEEHSSSFTYL